MDKRELTLAELDGEMALELPRRDTLAVAIGGASGVGVGGLIGAGVGANVQAPIDVNVTDNTICVQNVNVLSAGQSNAFCDS
jgi:hypothetical protein